MKKIYFVEKTIPFNSNDINEPFIGGSEKTLINISNELGKFDNIRIKVFNLTNIKKTINNVEWNNLNDIKFNDQPDILISMSDANLLSMFKCNQNFLWSHSVQPFEKFLRKKQLFSFLKYKPIMILEGKYHYDNRSFLTSLFGKKILPIAVDYEFINYRVSEKLLPEKNAIFTTRSDRNLDFLLNCWTEIKNQSLNSHLFINPPFNLSEEQLNNGIKLRVKGSKKELIEELSTKRVMLNPGHKGEVFCLAAEEARVMCIPIVTMGIGALKERVEHGITGFIAKNKNEFIDYTIKILNDDTLYMQLKKNLLTRRNIRSYKDVANDFIKIVNEN